MSVVLPASTTAGPQVLEVTGAGPTRLARPAPRCGADHGVRRPQVPDRVLAEARTAATTITGSAPSVEYGEPGVTATVAPRQRLGRQRRLAQRAVLGSVGCPGGGQGRRCTCRRRC